MDGPGDENVEDGDFENGGVDDENVHDGDFENDGDEVANAMLRIAMFGTPILRIAAGDVNPISRIAC